MSLTIIRMNAASSTTKTLLAINISPRLIYMSVFHAQMPFMRIRIRLQLEPATAFGAVRDVNHIVHPIVYESPENVQ